MGSLNIETKELKCAVCKNYLSYFPIKISPTINHQNICGRCNQSMEDIRNVAFETLARYLQFPCRYHKDGCSEQMLPRYIPQHEQTCFYKATRCPLRIYTPCAWLGSRPNQLLHCEDKHATVFLKDGEFQLDLTKSYECRNLLVHNKLLFVVIMKFYSASNLLKFSITHIEDSVVNENYFYRLFFKSDKRNLFIEEETTTFEKEKLTEVLLDSLKDPKGESSLVMGKIVLGDKNITVEENVNLGLLQQLQCSVCKEYAIPPIYQYGENQEIRCSECREKEKTVFSQWEDSFETTCNLTLSNGSRNFNLDKLASLLNYPCKYRENGCTFVAKPEEIKAHQSLCLHRVYECPLSEYLPCNWKGSRSDMKSHIQNQHVQVRENGSELSVNTATVKTKNDKHPWSPTQYAQPQLEKVDIISSSDWLFRSHFAIKGEYYYWAVQTIYCSEEKFKSEIEIVSKNNDKKILAKQACTPLMPKNQLYANEDHCSVFHADDFRTFLTTQKKLCFKVRITK